MKANGLSLDDKRQSIEDNDIPDLLEKWQPGDPKQQSDRKSKAFFIPKKEIKDNGEEMLG